MEPYRLHKGHADKFSVCYKWRNVLRSTVMTVSHVFDAGNVPYRNISPHDDRVFLNWLDTLMPKYDLPSVLDASVSEAAVVERALSKGEACRGGKYRQTLSALRGAGYVKRFVEEEFPELRAASGAKLTMGGEASSKWGNHIPLHDDDDVRRRHIFVGGDSGLMIYRSV